MRRQVNWPVAALLAVLVLSPALGDLHPKLSPLLMLEGFAVLALPFAFTSVVLAPGSRRGYAALIAALPLLSALFGVLMGLAEPTPSWGFEGSFEGVYRFGGALDNPEAFALLAFAGLAVALQEMTRPGRPYAGLARGRQPRAGDPQRHPDDDPRLGRAAAGLRQPVAGAARARCCGSAG